MVFQKTDDMSVEVLPEQARFLSDRAKIKQACKQKNVLAFDIWHEGNLIGFAMLRRFAVDGWFLWDYAIDWRYQGRKFGKQALVELIRFMETQHGLKVMTTTYVWGNTCAEHLYQSVGFRETDVVEEPDCHEVNMRYEVKP